MVNFKRLEEEIKKYREGFTYSNDIGVGKNYVIHSLPLKQSLRGLLSCWNGSCEVKYDAERDTMEHKLEKNGRFGIYREMNNDLPDELVILDNQSKVSKIVILELKLLRMRRIRISSLLCLGLKK